MVQPRYLGIDVHERALYLALLESSGPTLELRKVHRLEVRPGFTIPGLAPFLQAEVGLGVRAGIDASRMMLAEPRCWQWSRQEKQWLKARVPLRGRHCEAVLRVAGLGNPQWTPLADDAPGWMRTGVATFRTCEEVLGEANVFEVFPSASYIQMKEMADLSNLCAPWKELASFPRRAKDVMDAISAAYTVALYDIGRGDYVPGGDGLGGIVIPGRVPLATDQRGVLVWPINLEEKPDETT